MSTTMGEKVQSILDAGEDPIAVLSLPPPVVLDALDRPTWNVEDDMIVRQFRLLSRCCHPDKNDTADAAKAFERLIIELGARWRFRCQFLVKFHGISGPAPFWAAAFPKFIKRFAGRCVRFRGQHSRKAGQRPFCCCN